MISPVVVLRSNSGAGTAAVTAVTFSDRGTLLATGDEAGDVRLWSLFSHRSVSVQQEQQPAHSASVLSVAFVADDLLLSHARDHRVCLWRLHNVDDNQDQHNSNVALLGDRDSNASVTLIAMVLVSSLNFCRIGVLAGGQGELFDNTGANVVVAAVSAVNDSAIDIIDVVRQQRIVEGLQAPETVDTVGGMCMALQFFVSSAGAPRLLAAYENGTVSLFDPIAKLHLSSIKLHSEPILCMAVDVVHNLVFSGSADDHLGIATIEDNGSSLKLKTGMTLPAVGIADIAVRKDCKIIATAGWDHRIRLFSAKTQKPLAVLEFHREAISSVAFSSASNMLAAASRDKRISLWDSLYT